MVTAEDWQQKKMARAFSEPFQPQSQRGGCVRSMFGSDRSQQAQERAAIESRTPAAEYDQLHQFVGARIWDEAPLERELMSASGIAWSVAQDAVSVIDDTALPKKGKHSVVVANSNMQPCWASRRTARPWCR